MGVKLVNNIPKVIPAIKAQVAKGINNACQFGVSEAKDLAPEDTGFLKSHIGQTVTATPNSLFGVIRSLARYSGLVNFGTSKQAPQPYWTVAMLLLKQKFPAFILGKEGSAGSGVIRAAEEEFHGVFGRKGAGF